MKKQPITRKNYDSADGRDEIRKRVEQEIQESNRKKPRPIPGNDLEVIKEKPTKHHQKPHAIDVDYKEEKIKRVANTTPGSKDRVYEAHKSTAESNLPPKPRKAPPHLINYKHHTESRD